MKKVAHVICIKWGNKYPAEEYNLLYSMVKKNIKKHELKFYCFTNEKEGLDKGIIIKPMTKLNVPEKDQPFAYRKEAGLCDDNLGGLKGKRVLFFDVDMVITGSLDDLITYPKKDEFVIIDDWNTRGKSVGQASCYSWVVGTLGFIKKDFEADPKKWVKKFYSASQEYLSYKVIEKFGKLNFWPKKWMASFKFSCIPVWFLRPFLTPKLPKEAKVLAFHGFPKLEDALLGRWAKNVPTWKKIYKTIRPSPWLKKYLK
ncbi:MAG: hypothetical protein ACTSXL_03115 [Alphaproteobacteria bacterium]|nr:MAG: hypothetical protein B6I23_00695 [Rickettsiaceae bacterium 4572_127]